MRSARASNEERRPGSSPRRSAEICPAPRCSRPSSGTAALTAYEEPFDANSARIGESANETGDVTGFAPLGDIHRVRNVGDVTGISIRIYGTDVTRVGSSVRRYYDD